MIQPLINLALGGGVDGGKIVVSGQVFDLGAILNSSITFLITAAVVYFIFVLPMNAWKSKGDTDEKQESEVEEEIALLREIRDSLVAGANGTGGTTRAAKDPQD